MTLLVIIFIVAIFIMFLIIGGSYITSKISENLIIDAKEEEDVINSVLDLLFLASSPLSCNILTTLLPQYSSDGIIDSLNILTQEGFVYRNDDFAYEITSEGMRHYITTATVNQREKIGKSLFLAYEEKFSHEQLKELYILLNHLGTQKNYMLKYMDFLIQDGFMTNGKLTIKGSILKTWVEQALQGNIDYKELGNKYVFLKYETEFLWRRPS